MADKSAIEWTDATWNPIFGCSKVSPGCAHCYAETFALTRMAGKREYTGLPWTPENAAANVQLRPERIDQPIRWTRPRRIFVNSLSDLFHELVPEAFIDQIFAVMTLAPQHTFQVLTKRPERMRDYVLSKLDQHSLRNHELGYRKGTYTTALADALYAVASARRRPMFYPINPRWPSENVWLGTSIENDRWTGRADALRATPATVRFLSCEPLLGPLPSLDLTGIDWLIAGGESGPEHRPLDLDWVRDLRDRCRAAGVAFLFELVGGRTSKAGGRDLDGRTWDEYPTATGAR